MWPAYPSSAPRSPRDAGFTLLEVLIALSLTVLIMMMAAEVVTAMRQSSHRLRLRSDARETARKAVDYLVHHVRGASDLNPAAGNPGAVMVWYQRGTSTIQASFNNVTAAAVADIGTDILTMAMPRGDVRVQCVTWPGNDSASNARWNFRLGCPDGQANLDLFKALTGYDAGTGHSLPLIVADTSGNWTLYQITNYLDSWNTNQGCNQIPPELHVVANPGQSDHLNPPGAPPNLDTNPLNIFLRLGVQFISFRVRDGWLEQKPGLFDPTTDNPGTSFVRLMPNVEDLQVAWIFDDGQVFNSASQVMPAATYAGSVPAQGTALAYDVINVRGLRISVTARSPEHLAHDEPSVMQRPALEDHSQGPDDSFYHETVTALAMIRNRNLQQ